MSSRLHQLRPSNMMKPEVEGGVATFVCSWLVQFESNLSNYCTLYYYILYIYIIIYIYLVPSRIAQGVPASIRFTT